MKKSFCLFVLAILLICSAEKGRAENLTIGTKFPIAKLTTEKKNADNKLIVFVPSLTYDCEYASMLTQSFYYYFEQGLAFEDSPKKPLTEIFFVIADKPDESKSTQNILGKMNVIYDEKGELFSFFGVKRTSDKNADSTVVLLDSKDNIVLTDSKYRAQGEHLKPLETKLKQLNGISQKVKTRTSNKTLKIGNNAPDFQVDLETKLSDLRGKVVLISFYPAAFSGILPRPFNIQENVFIIKDDSMSCIFQIDGLDVTALNSEKTKRIVISSSTKSLLEKWQQLLDTENITYANDADYSISTKYFSYNPKGFNNRVSVIIDQKGKIAYIDKNFNPNDELVLNTKIEELLKQDEK